MGMGHDASDAVLVEGNAADAAERDTNVGEPDRWVRAIAAYDAEVEEIARREDEALHDPVGATDAKTEQEQRDESGLPGSFVVHDGIEWGMADGPHGRKVLIPPRTSAPLLYSGPGGTPEMSASMANLLRAVLPPAIQAFYGLDLPPETAIARALHRAMVKLKQTREHDYKVMHDRLVGGLSWSRMEQEHKRDKSALDKIVAECVAWLTAGIYLDARAALEMEAALRGAIYKEGVPGVTPGFADALPVPPSPADPRRGEKRWPTTALGIAPTSDNNDAPERTGTRVDRDEARYWRLRSKAASRDARRLALASDLLAVPAIPVANKKSGMDGPDDDAGRGVA